MYLDIYIIFLLNYLTHLGTDEKETHGQLKSILKEKQKEPRCSLQAISFHNYGFNLLTM